MERLEGATSAANARALQLRSRAAVGAGIEKAGTVEPKSVAAALHANQFDTVIGTIGFDEKGDVTGYEPFVWYVWGRQPRPSWPIEADCRSNEKGR